MPLPWSPMQEVPFDEVPVDGREHDISLYMEDTMWPYEDKFEEYIVRCGEVYARSLEQPSSMLKMHAAFQPALGSHLRREVILMQRISRPEALLDLLRTHIPAEYRVPGTWLHDALDLRDQWTSRLLRSSDVVATVIEALDEPRHDHRRRRGRRSGTDSARHRRPLNRLRRIGCGRAAVCWRSSPPTAWWRATGSPSSTPRVCCRSRRCSARRASAPRQR